MHYGDIWRLGRACLRWFCYFSSNTGGLCALRAGCLNARRIATVLACRHLGEGILNVRGNRTMKPAQQTKALMQPPAQDSYLLLARK